MTGNPWWIVGAFIVVPYLCLLIYAAWPGDGKEKDGEPLE